MSVVKPVRVVDPERTRLILVGVGGTGGYVLQQAARLLYSLKEQGRKVPGVLLIDGDVVEEKNLLRQYFLPQDIGRKKASVLAERYSRAYGLDIAAYPEYLTRETNLQRIGVTDGTIVVGAVDNGSTRRILHEQLHCLNHVVYIDSGNSAVTVPDDPEHVDRYQLAKIKDSGWEGQVVVGVRIRGEDVLPFPGEVFPDLIEEDRLPTEVSCGEVVVSNPQRLMTNLMAATTVLMYLHTLLADGTLLHQRTFFEARRGWMRSEAAIEQLLEVSV
ncbi:ThiF family adenylyltransferase [Alicyclobacillus macrosporangiidus]|uniref:ThiF family adenylyltransferase n=1 Tax=Alicyclobacillus macrosporangiidus TaxID=392015 RepID=UPI0004980797|nr:ThiF family adenylyltransferase [Alicyclobacillus macrosporangiidus]